jgi:hypothetical protein
VFPVACLPAGRNYKAIIYVKNIKVYPVACLPTGRNYAAIISLIFLLKILFQFLF